MSEKQKKTCKYLNYVEQKLASKITSCVSVSVFT